ncbi:MAG: aminoacylase, partial [Geminicoccaceae bacterium]
TGLKSMQERGRMQEGMIADIAILDPAAVTDNATYSEGSLPTTGIPFVLVNGETVVRDGEVQPDVFPGQAIRFPVEAEGRFEPLSEESWTKQYLAAPVGFHSLDHQDSHDHN